MRPSGLRLRLGREATTSGLVGGSVRRRRGRSGVVVVRLDLFAEHLHRLADALRDGRKLGGSEQQQDDREDEEQVRPPESVSEHLCPSLVDGYRGDAVLRSYVTLLGD